VFNKADLLSPAQQKLLKEQYPKGLFISAAQEKGLTQLLEKVEEATAYRWKICRLTLQPQQLNLLGIIYEKAIVTGRKEKPSGALELTLMATDGNFKSLQKRLKRY
ncbi:MAG: hypothetical protein IKA93_01635, partial [Elusimicrobiaceae bacterium]|nr:hypothetical protein [Elusimicrobiaceae bacterium]